MKKLKNLQLKALQFRRHRNLDPARLENGGKEVYDVTGGDPAIAREMEADLVFKVHKLKKKLKVQARKIKTGAQKALARLEDAATKDPNAQAILDAVYEKNPNLRPKNIKQLSPEESENILDFVD